MKLKLMKTALTSILAILTMGCASTPDTGAMVLVETADDASTARRPTFRAANGTEISIYDFDRFVDLQMQTLEVPGLSIAVISNGEVIYDETKGVANLDTREAVSSESIFEAASLSKPVFAYFVLRLVDKGILDLDLPLHQYLPMEELEDEPRYRSITARMVLAHTTGFPNWRWFDPAPSEWNIERGTMYMKHDPGTFGYSGEGYNYLALVIAHLTNNDMTSIDSHFQGEVAERLGMEHSSFIRTDFVGAHKVSGHKDGKVSNDGWPRSFPDDTPLTFGAAGRLHSNATDYAKFMLALMGDSDLDPLLIEEMLKEQVEIPEDNPTRQLTGQTAWGLGIAIEPTAYGIRYEHGGNNGDFQSGMMFFREKKLGYVFMTNSDRGKALNVALEKYLTDGR